MGKSGQATEYTLEQLKDIADAGSIGIPDDLDEGRKVVTAAGTRVALAASTACREVLVTAEEDNTGVIVVGGVGVIAALATREGTPLHPLDSVRIRIADLATVYIDSMVSGDGVTYSYEV